MKNKELKVKAHIPYEVDFDYLHEKVHFSLTEKNRNPTDYQFWEIIQFFSKKKISQPVDASFSKTIYIKCDDVEYTINCENLIARQVLALTLNLQNEKKSFHNSWYLYDYDECTETPQFIHSFFLVDDHKIIDFARISTSWMDECDINILIESTPILSDNSSLPLWNNMKSNLKATTLWCYQKFYQETERGQILAIRKNLPNPDSFKTKTSFSAKSLPLDPSLNKAFLFSSINKKLKWIVVILIVILIKMIFF